MRRPALLRDAIAIGFGLALAPAEAETWPTRPMTMVVPVAAGGTAACFAATKPQVKLGPMEHPAPG